MLFSFVCKIWLQTCHMCEMRCCSVCRWQEHMCLSAMLVARVLSRSTAWQMHRHELIYCPVRWSVGLLEMRLHLANWTVAGSGAGSDEETAPLALWTLSLELRLLQTKVPVCCKVRKGREKTTSFIFDAEFEKFLSFYQQVLMKKSLNRFQSAQSEIWCSLWRQIKK